MAYLDDASQENISIEPVTFDKIETIVHHDATGLDEINAKHS